MSRLVIVSNRLPVTTKRDGAGLRLETSSGGLATGLAGPHREGAGVWLGWPGPTWELSDEERAELDPVLRAQRFEPVHLDAREIERYYAGFSNGLLWPLFHYLLDQVPLQVDDWEAYEHVNRRFADEVVRLHRVGDRIWVHDYQLMLVPRLLRERLPDARIGFFLHIPFPAAAVLRALPRREEILHGLLGADLLGFHTHSYVRHFAAAVLRILGLETRVDRIDLGSREVRMASFPMGIDAAAFAHLGDDPDVQARAEQIRGTEGRRLLVGIDRLDYTKGIPRRLLAYEELLRTHSELCGRVVLLQCAVPSRGSVEAYGEFRHQIDALVGRINGKYATATWTPVRYLHQAQDRREVAALYRAADVMLVTPIRDGMNLVAKEFVATRTDEDGVLVLSEFAGAAAELDGALEVNPYDVQATGRTLARALSLGREERRARMVRLRRRVLGADVHGWVRSFLTALDETPRGTGDSQPSPEADVSAVLARTTRAKELVLLLDYDGTLVPFAETPGRAAPDEELLSLLGRLQRRARTQVHIVSGRTRADLERWFGTIGIGLHAEHGLWSRGSREATWHRALPGELPYASSIDALLEDWTARTPGSFVERKSVTLAWHWRLADPERGRRQASELRLHLAELLSNVPVEVVVGDHVVEVRPQGVHKGRAVALATASSSSEALHVAVGDDRTDEDLFAALEPDQIVVRVGQGMGRATLRLPGVQEVRVLLRGVAEAT